jgi:hypothetical protein
MTTRRIILAALLLALLAGPGDAHEPPAYADDAYPLGALQAVTQTLCDGEHATILQSLTAPMTGTYQLTQGRLSGQYLPRIVTAPWTGVITGDVLTWSPTLRDPRIVVLWEGDGCIFRMPVMEVLPLAAADAAYALDGATIETYVACAEYGRSVVYVLTATDTQARAYTLWINTTALIVSHTGLVAIEWDTLIWLQHRAGDRATVTIGGGPCDEPVPRLTPRYRQWLPLVAR